jgi:LAS superfamily LD-carboxypeptidase LdcB
LQIRRAVVALSVFALALGVTAPVAAASKKTSAAQQKAKALKAQLAQVTAQVQSQQARSVSARQAVEAASARLRTTRAEESAVQKRLAAVSASIKGFAVNAYVHGATPGVTNLVAVDNPSEIARAEHLRNSVVGSESDALDALASARQDLAAKRKAAESAAAVAVNRQRTVNDVLASLKRSRAAQLRLVTAAESRFQASLREDQVASRGSFRGGSVSLATVHGITVAASIAGQLNSMLNAADADGMRFGGTGYRSSSGQIAARRSNCGSSSYDIYEKPSSRCHPPTAKPGQSMHERGLAVDFTYNGSIINSRSNTGYRWLSAHARNYGFYNLPSEAWHWSVNGN